MTPDELHAFIAGVFIGVPAGLALGFVILPALVDGWYRLVRRRAR